MEKYRIFFERNIDRRWLVIGLIFMLAFTLRAIRPFMVDRIAEDGVLYVYMAKDISQGDLNSAFRQNSRMPPLYLYMMAGLNKMGMHPETAGKLISIIAGALLIIPIYLLAEMIFRSRLAALAAFLVAVNPDLVRISARVMRDSLFLTLLFTALYFIAKATRSEKLNLHFWALAGLFSSLGVAVRTETVEIIPVTILWITVELIIMKRKQLPVLSVAKKWLIGLLIMVAIYIITGIPLIMSLKGSPATWSIVDERIPGYIRTFFKLPAKEAIQIEDTL